MTQARPLGSRAAGAAARQLGPLGTRRWAVRGGRPALGRLPALFGVSNSEPCLAAEKYEKMWILANSQYCYNRVHYWEEGARSIEGKWDCVKKK